MEKWQRLPGVRKNILEILIPHLHSRSSTSLFFIFFQSFLVSPARNHFSHFPESKSLRLQRYTDVDMCFCQYFRNNALYQNVFKQKVFNTDVSRVFHCPSFYFIPKSDRQGSKELLQMTKYTFFSSEKISSIPSAVAMEVWILTPLMFKLTLDQTVFFTALYLLRCFWDFPGNSLAKA